jgi:type III restriction enzyme
VWEDVVETFSGAEMTQLYDDLEKVNDIRNTRVAHVETRLNDADEAWEAMNVWLRCLDKMIDATT